MRVLKAATIFALLMFIANCVAFHAFHTKGYGKTVQDLSATFGSAASVWVGLFSAGSLVSVPITGILGLVGMASSKQFGRSALVLGTLCCVLSAANFVLWKKYGGFPENHPGTTGPTPVSRQLSPDPPPHRQPPKDHQSDQSERPR
jgi:hypothetical protein